jgi:hypothetical protein
MEKKTPNKAVWYKRSGYLIVLDIVCLVIAYLLVSRAVDTGSWWEYLGALVFLMIAVNQFLGRINIKRKRE